MTPELKGFVLQTSDANQIKRQAVAEGMITLRRDGMQKILDGITTIEEVYRVSNL